MLSNSVLHMATKVPRKQLLRSLTSRIAIAMSGGVDSAAAAILMIEQGYDCIGVHMRNWDSADEQGSNRVCTQSQDWKDVQQVCSRLAIPVVQVDFTKEYWNKVFVPFLDGYEAGLKPNPDAYCNRFIKFHCLRSYISDQLGCGGLATGHYSRIRSDNSIISDVTKAMAAFVSSEYNSDCNTSSSNTQLLRSVDEIKDQSYFLALTMLEDFNNIYFPNGDYTKAKVRDIVRQRLGSDVEVLRKKESMGICFIGKRKMSDFLTNYFEPREGRFIDIDSGRVLGHHKGKEFYSVGQGARIGGCPQKMYVISGSYSDSADLAVTDNPEHPALYCSRITVKGGDINWTCSYMKNTVSALINNAFSRDKMSMVRSADSNQRYWTAYEFDCQCRIRHAQALEDCHVEVRILSDTEKDFELCITFDRPQKAVNPGQIVVLYDGMTCLGGAAIPIPH